MSDGETELANLDEAVDEYLDETWCQCARYWYRHLAADSCPPVGDPARLHFQARPRT